MKLIAHIESVGLYAPGLEGWDNSRETLRGTAAYALSPINKYKPLLLPANERRRATNSVRIAFGACEDAIGERLDDAACLASVFASSGGDYGIHDKICRALLCEDIGVSPTHFHNSVHNAAAGYWSIASRSRAPSISMSAHDFTVAAGFLEALPLVCIEELATLLVLSDCEVADVMHSKRPVDSPFACTLWLTPQASANSLGRIIVEHDADDTPETRCESAGLEVLRQDNPAARVLPLLELIATGTGGSVSLPTSSGQTVRITLDTEA
jgi:hypothetical protein